MTSTLRSYAVQLDGTRVLYHWDCCGYEQWEDFARRPLYRRRRSHAEVEAAFRVSWHSRANGGAGGACPRCLPTLADAERRLGSGTRHTRHRSR